MTPSGVGRGVGVGGGTGVSVGTGDGYGVYVGCAVAVGTGSVAVAVGSGVGVGRAVNVGAIVGAAVGDESSPYTIPQDDSNASASDTASPDRWIDRKRMLPAFHVVRQVIARRGFCQIWNTWHSVGVWPRF
jgi:hypothetical protein